MRNLRAHLSPRAVLLLLILVAPHPTFAEAPPAAAIRISPGSPPPPDQMRRMRDWHGRIYLPRLASVAAAWVAAEDDLAHWSRRGRAPGCNSLARTVDGLDLSGLLPTPDWTVSRHLQNTLWRLSQGAAACLDGRYFDARYHFNEGRLLWRALDRRLAPYGLGPSENASR